MRESVPTTRYLPVCNVLRQWKTSLLLTYRVYRLYYTIFIRKQEGLSTLWNYLRASLHQVYIVNQWGKNYALQQLSGDRPPSVGMCHGIHSAKNVVVTSRTNPSYVKYQVRLKGNHPSPYTRQQPVCYFWNGSNCIFPEKCSYAHVCILYYGNYPAATCNKRPSHHPPKIVSE